MATSIRVSRDIKIRQELLWIAGIAIFFALGYWLWGGASKEASVSETTAPTHKAVGSANPSNAQPNTTQSAPKSATSLSSVVSGIPEASQFASLFKNAGVAAELTGTGPYTIFVPSNKAFALLPSGTITGLTSAEKKRLVEYHVVPDRRVNIGAVTSGSIPSLTRDALNFQANISTGDARVNGASVVKTYQANNGIVYLIDQVLLPPKKAF